MSKEFEKKHKESFMNYLTAGADVLCVEHGEKAADCEDISCLIQALDQDDSLNGLDFDMNARDIADFEWLKEFIPGIIIYSAGGVVPFQAEGFISGMPFYYRERGGVASLSIANSRKECYGVVNSLYRATAEVEEFRNGPGWLSTLMNLVERLEKPSYLYHFQCDEVDFGADGHGTVLKKKVDVNGDVVHSDRPAWGFTAEEAFESVADFSELREIFCNRKKYDYELNQYLPDPDRNWSEEKFNEYVELVNVQPIVVKVEGLDRVYPDPEPVFEVKVPEIWRNNDGTISIPFKM